MNQLTLRRLNPATIGAIQGITRTPAPPPWIAEVEDFVLGGGAAPHLVDTRAAVLAIDLDAAIVGAVVHFPHERFTGAQWLAAILLDPRHRGAGLGHTILRAAVDHAASFSGRPYVAWAVHPDNQPAHALSRRLTGPVNPPLVDRPTNYLIYTYP